MKNTNVIATTTKTTTKELTYQFESFNDLVKGHKLAAVSASSLVKSLQNNMPEKFEAYLNALAIVGKFENKPLPSMEFVIDGFNTLEPHQFVKLVALNAPNQKSIDGLSFTAAIKVAAKVPVANWSPLA